METMYFWHVFHKMASLLEVITSTFTMDYNMALPFINFVQELTAEFLDLILNNLTFLQTFMFLIWTGHMPKCAIKIKMPIWKVDRSRSSRSDKKNQI